MTYIQPKGASHRAKRDFWSYLDAATAAGDKPVAIGEFCVFCQLLHFFFCCSSFRTAKRKRYPPSALDISSLAVYLCVMHIKIKVQTPTPGPGGCSETSRRIKRARV